MTNKSDRELASPPPQRERYVNTQIIGPVLNSNVWTAGGDIVLNGTPLRSSIFAPDDRVLLSSVDWDLLDISGIIVNNATSGGILATADMELRLLLMAIPPEGCIVLPPTYYYESPLCRALFAIHRTAIDQGYIRLVTEYADLDEYLDRKKERYQKAAHFPHYRDAYYSPAFPQLSSVSAQKTPKLQSIGKQSLNLWAKELDDEKSRIQLAPNSRTELQKRCFDTETPAFLWENVAEHLEHLGIDSTSLGANQLRALRTRLYLASYSLNGIAIPCGSSIVSDVLIPGTAARNYNLRAWKAIFEMGQLLDALTSYPVDRLLELKKREDIAVAIGQIRSDLGKGVPSDVIVLRLRRRGMFRKFTKAFAN